jgi:hypothetical protein
MAKGVIITGTCHSEWISDGVFTVGVCAPQAHVTPARSWDQYSNENPYSTNTPYTRDQASGAIYNADTS